MKWKYVLCFLFLSLPQLALAQNLERLTLPLAVKLALKNNPQIAILQTEITKAKAALQAASRLLPDNPELTGGITHRDKGNQALIDYDFSLSQPIEIKGQRHYRLEIARDELLKKRLSLKKKEFKLAIQIKELFVNLTALKQRFEATQALLQREEQFLKWLALRTTQGEISPGTLNMVRLEVFKTREKALSIRQQIIKQRQILKWTIHAHLPDNVKIVYAWPEFPAVIRLNKIKALAVKNNLEVKMVMLNLKECEARLNLIKAERFLPKVVFSLHYGEDDRDRLMGASLSVPLPVFNQKTGEYEVIKAERKKAILTLTQLQQKVVSDITYYYRLFILLKQERVFFEKNVLSVARDNLERMKKRYEMGEIALPMLVKAWHDWLETKMAYADLLQRYYHTLCQLELCLGIPLKGL